MNTKETNGDNVSAMQETENGDNIKAQMDDVIDSFVASNSKPIDEESDEGETKNEKSVEVEKDSDTKQDEKAIDEIDDGLMERAIRSGLTMEEAKSFSSKSLLESVLNKLESKSTPIDTTHRESEEQDSKEVDELKDLSLDPEVWDDELVKAFNAMKSIVKKYGEELAALRSAGESARAEDYFSTKFSSLDGGYRDVFGGAKPTSEQSAARAKVMERYKVLEAGYKSLGDNVSRDQMFTEAVESLEGVLKPTKKSNLEKRNSLSLSRPSHGYAKGDVTSVDDVKSMVAASISKFYD